MNNRVKAELAFAFSQMYEKDLAKVPVELQTEVLNGVSQKDFECFELDKPFTSQDLSEETLDILATIFNEEE